MIIDQVNTFLEGGAAVAARRLHQALLDRGVDSRFWYSPKYQSEPPDVTFYPAPWPIAESSAVRAAGAAVRRVFRWASLRLQRAYYRQGRRPRRGVFEGPRQAWETPYRRECLGGELLHLHWIEKLIDYPSFFRTLPDELPVVWTLHDMNPLTGGCHHAEECLAYASQCGDCPLLARPGKRDLAARNFQLKRAAFRGKRLHIVTPSRWLERRVRQSPLLAEAQSIRTIHNGLDLRQFAPMDKTAARRQLGLPDDAFVAAYGAASLEIGSKGIAEFLAALPRLSPSQRPRGLLFGRGSAPASAGGVELLNCGFLATPEDQVPVYSAADVFVLPSHAENMPQTVVESLACGTPVVAFAVGGVPEIVRPGETGLLARLRDVEHLAEQLRWMADHRETCVRMGAAGRRLVEGEFDHAQQVGKYLALYRDLT
jgi:glycosyltransferase involved in cell wall biosynthesis